MVFKGKSASACDHGLPLSGWITVIFTDLSVPLLEPSLTVVFREGSALASGVALLSSSLSGDMREELL